MQKLKLTEEHMNEVLAEMAKRQNDKNRLNAGQLRECIKLFTDSVEYLAKLQEIKLYKEVVSTLELEAKKLAGKPTKAKTKK